MAPRWYQHCWSKDHPPSSKVPDIFPLPLQKFFPPCLVPGKPVCADYMTQFSQKPYSGGIIIIIITTTVQMSKMN